MAINPAEWKLGTYWDDKGAASGRCMFPTMTA